MPFDAPTRWEIAAPDQAKQGRLAGTIRPDEADTRRGRNLEVDPLEHPSPRPMLRVVAFIEIPDANHNATSRLANFL